MSSDRNVSLVKARPEEFRNVMSSLQEAFAPAVHETFGRSDYGPIPPDDEVLAAFRAPGAAVYHVVLNGERAGGVVVRINEKSGHNMLELFFLSSAFQGGGGSGRMEGRGSSVPEYKSMGNRDAIL